MLSQGEAIVYPYVCGKIINEEGISFYVLRYRYNGQDVLDFEANERWAIKRAIIVEFLKHNGPSNKIKYLASAVVQAGKRHSKFRIQTHETE